MFSLIKKERKMLSLTSWEGKARWGFLQSFDAAEMRASPAFVPAASSRRRRTGPHRRPPRRPATPRPRPPPLRRRRRPLPPVARPLGPPPPARLPRGRAPLGRSSARPPPAVSLLDIRVTGNHGRGRVPEEHRVDNARVRSLLRAAARVEPEELFLDIPADLIDGPLVLDLSCFGRAAFTVHSCC
ncbi:hypothetical protein ACQJBY_067090 [Aegilops geniculata]